MTLGAGVGCGAIAVRAYAPAFTTLHLVRLIPKIPLLAAPFLLWPTFSGDANPVVATASAPGEEAFLLKGIPAPRVGDAGAAAIFTLVDGQSAYSDQKIKALNDGLLPVMEDDPAGNFFFADGGAKRLRIDLGKIIKISQFNSYSWHPGARGPQVYRLYGSDGTSPGFNAQPKAPLDPEKCGWKLIATVETRPKTGSPGGQYGVSVSDPSGQLGAFRYLLMDVSATDPADHESDTFYSEIDVIDRSAPVGPEKQLRDAAVDVYDTADKRAKFNILYGDAPDLKIWTRQKLAPVVAKWYPIISELLKSQGYQSPRRFMIKFANDYTGVAVTMGIFVECNPKWYRQNIDTEAVGSVVHELVHVVQQYGLARKKAKTPVPVWLTEGIADYVRWQLYEPKPRFKVTAKNLDGMHYDASYQTTADFLKWASDKYDKQLVPQLNAAARQGLYSDDLWKKLTGFTAPELGGQWRDQYAKKLGVTLPSSPASDPKQPAGK